MKKWIVIIGVIVLAYIVAAPHITVHNLKNAAQAHDGEALGDQIDFPTLRQNLKDQLNGFLHTNEDPQREENALVAIAAAIGSVIADRAVDAYVTPDALTRLMSSEDHHASTSTNNGTTEESKPFENIRTAYAGWDRFVITTLDEDDEEGAQFVLSRRGLGWKLTNILLTPADR